MRLATLSFLAAIFTAAVAVYHEPKRSKAWKSCAAHNACKDDRAFHRNAIYCMSRYWWGTPFGNDENCPEDYKKMGIDCHAYNGCVGEMSQWEKDPGAACRDWCLEGAKGLVICP